MKISTSFVFIALVHSCSGWIGHSSVSDRRRLLCSVALSAKEGKDDFFLSHNDDDDISANALQKSILESSSTKQGQPRVSSSASSPSSPHLSRRGVLVNGAAAVSTITFNTGFPREAQASSSKSRSDGYAVHKTTGEWKSQLTRQQYDILRKGGTERPNSSILEGEERQGIYSCAGCSTALFDSKEKFHSGTGWPSFAMGLEGVEVEKMNAVQASLMGAELRCATCGGHLGDIFADGFLFVGTPAFKTGKRFCIDGGALVFRSEDGSEVVGDQVPSRS